MPAPDRPTTTVTRPAGISIERSCRTSVAPRRTVTFSSRITCASSTSCFDAAPLAQASASSVSFSRQVLLGPLLLDEFDAISIRVFDEGDDVLAVALRAWRARHFHAFLRELRAKRGNAIHADGDVTEGAAENDGLVLQTN